MERTHPDGGRHFLVELSTGDGDWSDLADVTFRARAAASRARDQGEEIALVRSVYAPESNRLFLVYLAASEESVVAVTSDADLRLGRVSSAIELNGGGSPMS